MKVVVISDTHGQPIKIPECDLLLHCGDISPMIDHSPEFQKQWFYDHFLPELKALPAKQIVFIGGNHDFWLEGLCKTNTEWKLRKSLPPNIEYLRDNLLTLDCGFCGKERFLTVYGTPWVPVLKQWAFYAPDGSRMADLPKGVDILLTHSPPHGYCDRIEEWGSKEHLGSKDILEAVKKASPLFVFCGHIHSGAHVMEVLAVPDHDHTTLVRNCALLNESYKQAYSPLELTI